MIQYSKKGIKMILLEVKDLSTYFYTDSGIIQAVDGVSFKVNSHMTMGIMGESGCGKSVTALSIMQLISSPPGKIIKGNIIFMHNNKFIDLSKLNPKGSIMRSIRGNEISMVFQDPMTTFNPVYSIGEQIMEAIVSHQKVNKNEAREKSIEMLVNVKFPNPDRLIDRYPHQLSGGLIQRAMIAMALSCYPSLLIADEPTTALDVTIQAQILELMKQLQEEFGMAIIFITHDLGVINEICDEVAVMYLGEIVEYAKVNEIFQSPGHPYTRALLKSLPTLSSRSKRKLNPIKGTIPVPINIGKECRFLQRCIEAKNFCYKQESPPLVEIKENHWVRCWCEK